MFLVINQKLNISKNLTAYGQRHPETPPSLHSAPSWQDPRMPILGLSESAARQQKFAKSLLT
jgi:hypothetical protein